MVLAAGQRIPQILEELAVAIVSGDAVQAFGRYTTPDYRFTSPASRLSNKNEILQAMRAGFVRFISHRNESVAVREYGDAAVALGVAIGEGVNPASKVT